MAAKTDSLNYLEARERFIRSMARLRNHEEELRRLLGASDTGADLEEKMLRARGEGRHTEAIAKLNTLGLDFDRAGDALDMATELQRRRVAAQEKQFDDDLYRLEC